MKSFAVFAIALFAIAAVAVAWDASIEDWQGSSQRLSKSSDNFAAAGEALNKYLDAKNAAEQAVNESQQRDQERDQAQQNANYALGQLDDAKEVAINASSNLDIANKKVADLRAAYDAAVDKLKRDETIANDVFERLRVAISDLIKEASANGSTAAPETLALLQTLSKLDSKVLPQALAQVDASQLADANRWNELTNVLDQVRDAQTAVAGDISAVAAANAALNAALREQAGAENDNANAIAARDQAQQTYDNLKRIYESALGVAAEARAQANAAIQLRDELWSAYLHARGVALDSFAQARAVIQIIEDNVPPTSYTVVNTSSSTAAAGGAPEAMVQVKSSKPSTAATLKSQLSAQKQRRAVFMQKLSAMLNGQDAE